tara:strand:+ start:320 stop:745 length:426 start_codon:yes stop_codon:yes gene_type:complete
MEDLAQYELGVTSIEIALKNGLRLVPENGDISIKKASEGYNKEWAPTIVEMLKHHKKDILAIISDRNYLRKTLIEAHRTLSDANNSVVVLLDLLDRLQNIEEIVYPGKKECLYGEKGCPDDSVVYCNVCARKRGWSGGYSE